MTMSPAQVQTLQAQFQALKTQLDHVSILPEQWFSRNDLFHSSSFYTRSDELRDYINELAKNVEKVATIQDPDMLIHVTERIATQFACFRGLLNSIELNTKNKTYNRTHRKRLDKVKQFAKQAAKSSQSLYKELSELQEFERRLVEMVAEKQATLSRYQGQAQRQSLQEQVLVTQQRLGRCRKAISQVEEQIQKLDDKQAFRN